MLIAVLLCIFAGTTVFLALWMLISAHQYSGKLIIDESDAEVDRWTIFYDEPVDLIREKKSIKLKIERRN